MLCYRKNLQADWEMDVNLPFPLSEEITFFSDQLCSGNLQREAP